MMLIAICGMQRSGSTFSFNIARELLKVRGGVCCSAIASTAIALENVTSNNLIIKNHELDGIGNSLLRVGAIKGICTIRDPYEAIESWMEVFGFTLEQSIVDFSAWLRSFQSFQEDVLVLRFDTIQEKPLKAILKIARHLGIYPSPIELYRLWKNYKKDSVGRTSNTMSANKDKTVDIGFSYFDKETFFHRGHVRLQKSVVLTPSERERIAAQIPDFLDFYHRFFRF